MSTEMFLTDTEIDAICGGIRYNATKRKRLRAMGLVVNEKPNGRPLVVRSHAEAVLSGLKAAEAAAKAAEAAPEPFRPDREAYILKFRRKAA